MLIRPMTIDDYEEVYSLWMSCKGMGLNNLDDSKEGIEKFLIHMFCCGGKLYCRCYYGRK